jgi:DNA-binding transcriptional LysR family regulator
VDVADVLSEPCIDSVVAGRADFAIAAVRAESPSLQAQIFCSDDSFLVCPVDHPLATADEVQVRDLAAYPFIHLSRTSSVRQYLDAAMHPQSMNTLMEVDQLATVMGMVRAGLGISVVPALALFHFRHPEIAVRPLPLRRLQRQLYLVRRRDSTLSTAAQALCDLALTMRPGVAPARATRGRKKLG